MPNQDKVISKTLPQQEAYVKSLQDQMQVLNDQKDNIESNLGNIVSQKAYDPMFELSSNSYNPNSTTDVNKNYQRYYSHPDYDKLGFSPWSDNESLYNEKGSASGDIWRATKTAGKLAVTGFMSPIRSYGDLLNGDALNPDYDSGQEMARLNMQGMSTREGASGFAANLITNSGYTLGLIGEMALETYALTRGVRAAGGTTAPSIFGRIGKFAKDFGRYNEAVADVGKSVEALSNYSAAKSFWEGTKGVAKFLNPLSNTVDAVQAVKASDQLTALGKFSTTAGGFFRDVQMANLTLAEAKLEGAMTEKDLEAELIGEWREGHNKYLDARNAGDVYGMEEYSKYKNSPTPNYKELLRIKDKAADAGMKTLAWNIPTIFLTNKITFGSLFKSFEKPTEYTLRNGVSFIEKEGEGFVQAGFKNKIFNSLKPKNLLKAPIKYFSQNLSEGVQETAQEVVSGTAKEYYKGLYHSTPKAGLDYAQGENQSTGVWDALAKNVTDQFSGRGFETFASGFLMGGLIKPVSGALRLASGYQSKEYRHKKREYAEATLAKLNEVYADPLKYFGPGIINYTNTAEAATEQNDAQQKGSQKDWLDAENQNLISNVMTALDTDTYDVFVNKLRSLKTMDAQAIKDAYGVDGQEALNKIDKVIARAEQIKTNYDTWNDRYANPFNPRNYKKDTPEYNAAAIGFSAWENAKKLAIFNETTFQRNANRIEGIGNDILQHTELRNLPASDISVLFTPANINNELRLLDNEIEVLNESIVPGDRSVLANKKTKQKRLLEFQERLRGYYIGQSFDKLSKAEKAALGSERFKKTNLTQLKKAYEDYIKHLATSQTNLVFVNGPDLNKSFQQLLDLHELKQENVHYAEAINIMIDPKGFVDQYKRLNQTFTNLYNHRHSIIEESVATAQSKIEDNTILNALYQKGFTLSPESAEKLLKDKVIPTEFYDVNAKQVVDSRDPIRYGQFAELIHNYVEATKPDVVATPQAVPTGVVITNLADIIAAGSGRLEIEVDGKPVEFTAFDIAIDKTNNTAEITYVQKKDPTKDKGVGYKAYIELGQRLGERNITLVSSPNNAKKQSGIDLWNRLVKAGYATGSSNKGYTFINVVTEPVAVTPVEETQVVEDARELHVDIAKKFDSVHNGEQLANLVEELTVLMADTTLEERLKAGLNSKNIDEKIKDKESELLNNISLDNLFLGNIVSMLDPDYGNMKIIRKNAYGITLQKIGDNNTKVTIEKDKLKLNIKFKYSDKMGKEVTKATQAEKDRVADNISKSDKFLENREALQAVMEEAYADEEKFQKEFTDNLGCK